MYGVYEKSDPSGGSEKGGGPYHLPITVGEGLMVRM